MHILQKRELATSIIVADHANDGMEQPVEELIAGYDSNNNSNISNHYSVINPINPSLQTENNLESGILYSEQPHNDLKSQSQEAVNKDVNNVSSEFTTQMPNQQTNNLSQSNVYPSAPFISSQELRELAQLGLI